MKQFLNIENRSFADSYLKLLDRQRQPLAVVRLKPYEKISLLVNASFIHRPDTVSVIPVSENVKPYQKLILQKLPPAEKKVSMPTKFNFRLVGWCNKLCIDISQNEIYINPDFVARLGKYETIFTIGHEIGHHIYTSEWKADLFAIHYLVSQYIDPRLLNFRKIFNSQNRIEKILTLWKWVQTS